MEKKIKRRRRLKLILKKKIIHLNLMVEEANLIARELKKRVGFQIDLLPGCIEDDQVDDLGDHIRIRVENYDHNYFCM